MSVYFAEREGLIKIGCSKSVKHRVLSLSAKLLGSIPGGRREEKEAHSLFAHLRVRGEWFSPGEDLLLYIKTHAQEHEPDSNGEVLFGVRLPKSWFRRLDDIAEHLSQPGMRVNRAEVARMSIVRGLNKMESEQLAKEKR
jgi:hypothetical protein